MPVLDCADVLVSLSFDEDTSSIVPIQMLYKTKNNKKHNNVNNKKQNSKNSAIIISPFSTRFMSLTIIIALIVFAATCAEKSNNNFQKFVATHSVSAFAANSPIANLDPADVSLPSVEDVDKKVHRFNLWIRGKYQQRQAIPNSTTNDEIDKIMDENLQVPFEVRRVSKESSTRKKSGGNKNSPSFIIEDKPSATDHLLKVFATRDVNPDKPELRIPAKHILSFHTICPKLSRRLALEGARKRDKKMTSNENNNDNRDNDQIEDDPFCQLAEFLYKKLSFQPDENKNNNKEDHKNYRPSCFQGHNAFSSYFLDTEQYKMPSSSSQLQFNYEDFEISMMSLFLVYARWGNNRNNSTSASFFRPFIDIFPRVPASPICTFTDADLSILTHSMAKEIKNERDFIEEQWNSGIFETIFSSTSNDDDQKGEFRNEMQTTFHHLFPKDSLTLARFFWAQCTVKSKMARCFDQPSVCIFPLLDLAGYRTELSVYGPKHLSNQNQWKGYSFGLALIEETKAALPSISQSEKEIDSFMPSASSSKSETMVEETESDSSSSSSSSAKKKKSKKLKKRKRTLKKAETPSSQSSNEDNDSSRPRDAVRTKIVGRSNLAESLRNGENLEKMIGVVKFSYKISKDQELTLDRERRAMPFINRGIIDLNTRGRCAAVNLPTFGMKKKLDEFLSSSSTAASNKKVQNPRTLFDDPADCSIAQLYTSCLGFIFDKSDHHPQHDAKVNERILSSSINNDKNNIESTDLSYHFVQPYTCVHITQDQVMNFVAMIEGLGIFDTNNCTIQILESEVPVQSSAETQLRSVALLGKLVRAQLERVSSALTTLEESYTTKLTAKKNLAQKEGAKRKKKNNSTSSKKREKSKSQQQQEQQEEKQPVSAAYQEYLRQQKKQLANEASSTSEKNRDAPKLSKAAIEGLSSCSPESPTQCKILEDPFPRHMMLIQEYLQNEHSGLLSIYETLSKMREYLRKEIELGDYMKPTTQQQQNEVENKNNEQNKHNIQEIPLSMI